jgi:TonB family protein
MRAIVSIRTATRWLSCSAALALAACTTTEQYYTPATDQPRMNTDLLRDRGHNLVRAECPRLLGVRQTVTGVAHIKVDVERGGEVRRATIVHSSGDERMDEIFGGLAAQLKVDPPENFRGETMPGTLRLGYSCSPTASTITVEGVTMTATG